MPKFKTTIMQAEDMNATGIVVPEDVVAKLGQGKKPKVVVLLKGYSYRSTIHVMGGKSLLPLAKEHREKSGGKRPIDPAFCSVCGFRTLIAGMSAGGEALEIGTTGC